ncbi:hypothetical protein HK104_004255 [Borealophlyctis nickersoniae]|nr:hypothetical protein HK104_004255 [Borealophlyctis nickersoniae]
MPTPAKKSFSADGLPGKNLETPIRELLTYGPNCDAWPKPVVSKLVDVLRGHSCIDGRGENRAGAMLYDELGLEWERYLRKPQNKDLYEIMDPHYVLIVHPLPDGFEEWISTWPAEKGVGSLPPPVPPTNYLFPFGDNTDAMYFIRAVTDQFPGTRALKLTTTALFVNF